MKRPRQRTLELDSMLDAFTQDFMRAQARLEQRQLQLLADEAQLLRAHELMPPLRLHHIGELSVEFECSATRVRFGPSWRLGLRLGRRGKHRVRLIVRADRVDQPRRASAELQLDGQLVRRVCLPAREPATPASATRGHRSSASLLLISLRDSERVASILGYAGARARRATTLRAARACGEARRRS